MGCGKVLYGFNHGRGTSNQGGKSQIEKNKKLNHAHNNTIDSNPLIYIILLERSKKFFRMADLLQPQDKQLELDRSLLLLDLNRNVSNKTG